MSFASAAPAALQNKTTVGTLIAAGATLLTGSAQASVVSLSDQTLVAGGTVQLASNLTLNSKYNPGSSPSYSKVYVDATFNAGIAAGALQVGDVVNSSLAWNNWAQLKLYSTNGGIGQGPGYYGLRGGDGNYGWIHVKSATWDTGANTWAVDYDFAFESAAGTAIAVGALAATPPTSSDVPEPGALALVAAGLVAGAAARRRARAAA